MRRGTSIVSYFIVGDFSLSSMKVRVGRSSIRISFSDLSNCLVILGCFKKSTPGGWGPAKTSSFMDGNMVLDAYFT